MLRTFNCGVGMILIIPSLEKYRALELLKSLGEEAWELGYIEKKISQQPSVRYYNDY